jgi:hypothetical protein
MGDGGLEGDGRTVTRVGRDYVGCSSCVCAAVLLCCCGVVAAVAAVAAALAGTSELHAKGKGGVTRVTCPSDAAPGKQLLPARSLDVRRQCLRRELYA